MERKFSTKGIANLNDRNGRPHLTYAVDWSIAVLLLLVALVLEFGNLKPVTRDISK
jgi:hypothetical protein